MIGCLADSVSKSREAGEGRQPASQPRYGGRQPAVGGGIWFGTSLTGIYI